MLWPVVSGGRAVALVGKRLVMRSGLAFLENKEEGDRCPQREWHLKQHL